MKIKLLITTLFLIATGWYAYHYYQSHKLVSIPTITTYEECIDDPGSSILESYPSTCITHDGSRFIQPISSPLPTPSPATYTCPESGWVDCMPGPDQKTRTQCNQDYLDWATEHCPDFQGTAF